MIGEVIGNYRIVSELGKGGMGVVYRAEHVQLGRPAALKMLLTSYSGDESIVQRFFNEARAASSIDHPGIVEIYDFGTHTNGAAYIVMALLKGESLEQRLKRSSMSPIDGATIVTQVVAALAAAHARGIVHRDLKPDNIFLVPNELIPGGIQVKLLDFGIAKLADEQAAGFKTQTGALIGTPAYMSPEQCMGRADLDHRTDLYAIGCILFHMLCGRPPFVSDQGTGMMIAAQIRDAAPDPRTLNPNVPAAIAAIVQRCLEKDPASRFQTATELRHALIAAGANAPLSKPGTESHLTRPSSEQYMATLAVAGAAATTASSSAGQINVAAMTTLRTKRSRVWLGVGGLLLALVGVGAVVALQSKGQDSPVKANEVPTSASVAQMNAPGASPPVGSPPLEVNGAPVPPQPTCPLGQERSPDTQGHCCWPAQAWSTAANHCIGTPSCPAGATALADQCIVHHTATPTGTASSTATAPPLRLNARTYQPGDTIEIQFAAAIRSPSESRAWVTIAGAGSPSSSYGAWSYVEDGATAITLKAPDAAGAYEVRLHTDYPAKSYNVRQRVPITVAGPSAAEVTPLVEQRFSVVATTVHVGGELDVRFAAALHAATGERFWITVTALDAPDTASGTWEYVLDGARRARLKAPTTSGDYEVRLHANYPTKMTNIVHRVTIRVDD